jgi:DNA repair protein RecO (recombination protein O)
MNTFETEAIVLTTRDYGESDRLIDFYTHSTGRLKGLAKGARKSRKRFVHTFESSSLVQLTYKENKSLIWIEACKLLEPHLALRVEMDRWAYSALVSELLLEMVPEGEAQAELFILVKHALERLSQGRDPLNSLLLFMIRFMHISGYLPAFECCKVCGQPLKSQTSWYWRTSDGVLTCPKHTPGREKRLVLDLGTLMLIRQCRSIEMDKIWRLHIRRDKKDPLLDFILDWVRCHIRKDLKTFKLLQQVRECV